MDFHPSTYMSKVRETRPLVHHITNYVTVNDCANVCICAGGSPVMTDGPDTAEMVGMVSSTVLNIGTLNPRTVDSMVVAARAAKGRVPIVLDPVGAGATAYRTETSEHLLSMGPDVVKGNAGEIGVLSGAGGEVRGVDSHGSSDIVEAVRGMAGERGCVVAATGERDVVSDGKVTLVLSNGTPLLSMVSGTGCMVSSVVGCYVGACGADVWSVASAITAFNVAAEHAASVSRGPGTFRPALLDSLHSLEASVLDDEARWESI